jgi:Xaa-Pro aminopeptidase
MDPFVPAIEELAQALLADEDAEQALADIAGEHGLAAQALRNRAIRTLGPLESYRQRQKDLKKQQEQTALRRDPVLAGASFVAAVSNLSARLSAQERQAEIERLAAEYGVDAASHRDAIERLRRR